MTGKKVGPAGTIDLDDDTRVMFGLMVLHVLSKKRAKSPLLKIEPVQRDDGLSEILFERLAAADEIIRYLITHLRVLDPDIIPLHLFKEVMKEAAMLYDVVLDAAKEKDVSIGSRGHLWFKPNTIRAYEKIKQGFRFIKPDHLQIDYDFAFEKERRDFVARIVDKYFDDIKMKAPPKTAMNKLLRNLEQ